MEENKIPIWALIVSFILVIFAYFIAPNIDFFKPSTLKSVDTFRLDSNITPHEIAGAMAPIALSIKDSMIDDHFEDAFVGEPFTPQMTFTRGVRNNNPCNLVANNQEWFGQVGADGRFMVFDTPEHGIRTCAVMIRNYYDRHKLDTVRKIVTRMAPEHENDTHKYMRQLARILKVGVDEKINFIERMHDVLAGIIFLENGKVPAYTESLFIPYSYQANM